MTSVVINGTSSINNFVLGFVKFMQYYQKSSQPCNLLKISKIGSALDGESFSIFVCFQGFSSPPDTIRYLFLFFSFNMAFLIVNIFTLTFLILIKHSDPNYTLSTDNKIKLKMKCESP